MANKYYGGTRAGYSGSSSTYTSYDPTTGKMATMNKPTKKVYDPTTGETATMVDEPRNWFAEYLANKKWKEAEERDAKQKKEAAERAKKEAEKKAWKEAEARDAEQKKQAAERAKKPNTLLDSMRLSGTVNPVLEYPSYVSDAMDKSRKTATRGLEYTGKKALEGLENFAKDTMTGSRVSQQAAADSMKRTAGITDSQISDFDKKVRGEATSLDDRYTELEEKRINGTISNEETKELWALAARGARSKISFEDEIKRYAEQDTAKAQALEKEYSDLPDALRKGGQFVGTLAQMAPNIIAGLLTKRPAIGGGMTGISSGGAKAKEAIANGASISQAYDVGMRTAGKEMLTEKALGNIPGIGEGKFGIDNILNNKFGKSAGTAILGRIVKAPSEGLEEVISTAAQPFLDRVTYDQNAPLATPEELWDSFRMGTAASLAIGGPFDILEARNTAKAIQEKVGAVPTYNPGETVKLANGEIGKVVQRSGQDYAVTTESGNNVVVRNTGIVEVVRDAAQDGLEDALSGNGVNAPAQQSDVKTGVATNGKSIDPYINEATRIKPVADEAQDKMVNNLKNAFAQEGFEIIDPGAKSVDSLSNKVYRKVENEGNTDYDIYSPKDHVRSSIAMNSVEDIPRVMEKLVQIYPNLKAEFKREIGTGYIGFHLTTPLESGLNGEIQLTTADMFKTKLATDGIYDKWRSKKLNELTPFETRQYDADMETSRNMWAAHAEKTGLTPEVIRRASDSLTAFASNISPIYPVKDSQEPFLNSKVDVPGVNKANSLPDSVTPYSTINTPPSAQDSVSRDIVTASQEDSLTARDNSSSVSSSVSDQSPPTNSKRLSPDSRNTRSPLASQNTDFSMKPSPNDIIHQNGDGGNKKSSQEFESIGRGGLDILNARTSDANTTPELPRTAPTGKGDTQSNFAGNVEKSGILDNTAKELIGNDSDVVYYEGITNKATLEAANAKLNEGGEAEVRGWLGKDEKNATAQDVAEGFILLKRYQDAEDYRSMVEVARKLRKMGTSAGQAVQAYSMLSRMTPEGMVNYAQSELDDAFKAYSEKKSEKWRKDNESKFTLSDQETAGILMKMQEVAKLSEEGAALAKDGAELTDKKEKQANQKAKQANERAKKVLIGEVQALIQSKLPTSTGAKVKALQRVSLLLNLKTNVRNILGNVTIMPQRLMSDVIATPIDKAIARKTGVRTTALPSPQSMAKGFVKGAYETFDDFRRGINTLTRDGNRFEIGQAPAFNPNFAKTKPGKAMTKALAGLDRVTSLLLEAGDRPFFEMYYLNSINTQMKANKAAAPTADMMDIAMQTALENTYQDSNGYTKAVNNIRKFFNAGKEFGVGDLIIPFAKTPANLTRALVEFSPVGLAKALSVDAIRFTRAVKNGTATPQMQRKLVNGIGKGITGTLTVLAGAILANAGMISGGGDEDKDANNFARNVLGIQPYSVTINGKSYTYDWSAPVGSLLAIGADIMEGMKSGKEKNMGLPALGAISNSILNAFETGGAVLFNQSFFQGVAGFFNEGNFFSALIKSILSGVSQFVPSLSNQIAQLTDPVQRTSYVYGDELSTAANKVAARIPGASTTLEPVVDVYGREVQRSGGENHIGNVMLNPANVAAENKSPVANEVWRIYQQTGDKTVFPQVAPYYVTNGGEKYTFTPQERTAYQKRMGTTNDALFDQALQNGLYAGMSDTEKAKFANTVNEYSTALAKMEYLDGKNSEYEPDKWILNAKKLQDEGGNAAEYLLIKQQTADIKNAESPVGNDRTIDSSSGLEKKKIIDAATKDEAARKQYYEMLDIGKGVAKGTVNEQTIAADIEREQKLADNVRPEVYNKWFDMDKEDMKQPDKLKFVLDNTQDGKEAQAMYEYVFESKNTPENKTIKYAVDNGVDPHLFIDFKSQDFNYNEKMQELNYDELKEDGGATHRAKKWILENAKTPEALTTLYEMNFENSKTKGFDKIRYAKDQGVRPEKFLQRAVEAFDEKGDPKYEVDLYYTANGNIMHSNNKGTVDGTKMRDTMNSYKKGGYTDKEIDYFYQKEFPADDKYIYAKYAGIKPTQYVNIKGQAWNIKGEKGANGKTISGSKKKQYIAFLESQGITGMALDVAIGLGLDGGGYTIEKGKRQSVANYIYEIPGLTQEEQEMFLKAAGLEAYIKSGSGSGGGSGGRGRGGRGKKGKAAKTPKPGKISVPNMGSSGGYSSKLSSYGGGGGGSSGGGKAPAAKSTYKAVNSSGGGAVYTPKTVSTPAAKPINILAQIVEQNRKKAANNGAVQSKKITDPYLLAARRKIGK